MVCLLTDCNRKQNRNASKHENTWNRTLVIVDVEIDAVCIANERSPDKLIIANVLWGTVYRM